MPRLSVANAAVSLRWTGVAHGITIFRICLLDVEHKEHSLRLRHTARSPKGTWLIIATLISCDQALEQGTSSSSASFVKRHYCRVLTAILVTGLKLFIMPAVIQTQVSFVSAVELTRFVRTLSQA